MDIESLNATTILEDETFTELFEEPDEIERARLINALTDKAKLFGVKTKFENLLKVYVKAKAKYDKEMAKPAPRQTSNLDNVTIFDGDYTAMSCGNWIADNNGVRTFGMFGEILACYHPILPTQRLINAETGKEKIKLAFKKGCKWKEIIVDKGVIASSNKIVSLADYGVSVTSETSKNLVRYLSDIENFNIDLIGTQTSTSKLGWIDKEFMPYGANIIFDNESRFKEAYESIKEFGSEEEWFSLAKKVRKSNRFEPNIYMIGSLASVLIEPLNALPFIINLWGDTGKGKTVAIMLAASIWAYPGGNDYITDPKSTPTALELRLDFLNNLPMLVDDMAQLKEKYNGDFSELVYMLCSGKGKDRANVGLGLNKATTWRNVILTNGEHSLVTETMQGGAVNRIIDVEMQEGYIFENGNQLVETIKQNYGFCGRMFIDAINEMGIARIKEMQSDFYNEIITRAKLLGIEKEEKQMLPMSILLTADKIANDYIFNDGQTLDFDYCVELLKNKGEVSENVRAYDFIMSEISINLNKFKPDNFGDYKGEIWGCFETDTVVILSNIFNRMCERGNFSSKSFLSWASKKDLLIADKGRNTKKKRMDGGLSWCVCLKMVDEVANFKEEEKLPFM